MAEIAIIIGLLAGVSVLALVARRVNLPYPTVMVVAGLLVSLVPGLPRVRLKPELVMTLFLPPLLYAAAWEMSWREFRANLRPILLLAVGFVLFNTAVVAVGMRWVMGAIPWAAAVALGAIVSPPDPIAATSILGRLGVPRRVRIVLEGESLVNDASGLTIYRLAIAAAVAGPFGAWTGVSRVAEIVAVGVAIGLAVGWVMVRVHRRLNDPTVETVITLVTPYAASLPAEALGDSSVLAVVVMGLYMSHNSYSAFGLPTRMRTTGVWDVVDFAINGLTFILMGLQLPLLLHDMDVADGWWRDFALQLSVLIAIVTAARFVWTFAAAYVPRWLVPRIRKRDPAPSWREVVLTAFTGMRGVISLGAALAIPHVVASGEPFPHRGPIILLTFGLIVATLVFQSLTLPLLVRWLGLSGRGDSRRCEAREARLESIRAALRRADELSEAEGTDRKTLEHIRELYRSREQALADALDGGGPCAEPDDPATRLRRDLIGTQRDHVRDMFEAGRIDEATYRDLSRELDLEELQLSSPG